MKSRMRHASLLMILLTASLAIQLGFAQSSISVQAFQKLENRLQALESKEAIRHLLETYIDKNESRDYRGYSQLFASNGELVMRSGSPKGPDNIYQTLEKNFGGPLAPNSPLRNASHILSNMVIEVDGDTASARSRWTLLSPAQADGQPKVSQSGSYTDKLVKENGEWKFLQRIITTSIPVPKPDNQ